MSASPAGDAATAVRRRGSSLGVRLAMASALITSVVVAAAFVTLRERIDAEVRAVFVRELLERERDVSAMRRERLQLLLAAGSVVSTSPTLRAALDTRSFEDANGRASQEALLGTIQREVQRLYRDVGKDLLVVTDNSGRVLAGEGRGGAPSVGQLLTALPAVRSALSLDSAGTSDAFGVLMVSGTPMQVGSVPVLVNGFPIGALIIGERLDHAGAPGATKGPGESAEVVVAGGRVLASTLRSLPAGSAWTDPVADTTGAASINVGDDELLAAGMSLGLTESGHPAHLFLVHSLSASLRPLESALRRQFLLGGLLAVLLVAACAGVVARSALRPLNRFVSYLQVGADGASLAPFRHGKQAAPAEIHTLTDAFNGLVGSVQRQQQQLERRSIELTAANEVLRAEVHERERAEAALTHTESQLRHSQKLEALGTLAGGVAHDFNNVLGVIMGYAQLLALEVPKDSRMRADIDCISGASERARELVRQLLAFSRKQVLKPRLLSANDVIGGMQRLFPPLLGEAVMLDVRLEPEPHHIMADPTQLEQVLLNLVVNARDAMSSSGGTVTIETKNVVLDDQFADDQDGITSGPAVLLSVRDTGIGMDEATQRRIFEPFFTTKAPGQGTGLGLATVYGIVHQSGGFIDVESAPSQGTTFRVYFPVATDASGAEIARAPSVIDESSGSETVLVVEDEMDLRLLVRRVLEHRGYEVLEAADGRAALDLIAGYFGELDLLLTDVVLPHVSGIELADELRLKYPAMRVLFVSGYNEEVVERHGHLAEHSEFLAKPVLPDVLARAVRRVLDGQSLAEAYA